MAGKLTPRLRTVEKIKPPYPINKFPKNFGYALGEHIIYRLATKSSPTIEGHEWEEIFAACIGAEWKPSNVGLDDVKLNNCAWGAKTVKAKNPSNIKRVRLISGRNSPSYSYDSDELLSSAPDALGEQVLEIWNQRVSSIRAKFEHLRTVVLIKGPSLRELTVFEFETVRYSPEEYYWKRNQRGNLERFFKTDDTHKFTWQHSGSQFTIIEKVPTKKLVVKLMKVPKISKDDVLEMVKFNKDWLEVISL